MPDLAHSQEAREQLHAIHVAEQLAELNAKTLAILAEAREAAARIEQVRGDQIPEVEALPTQADFAALPEEQQRILLQRYQAVVKQIALVGRRLQDEKRNALAAIAEARAQVEMQAKLQGDLTQEGIVNIWISPEWASARTSLLEALRPFPEARAVVAQALLAIEAEAEHVRPA